jgi:hypothetical protein
MFHSRLHGSYAWVMRSATDPYNVCRRGMVCFMVFKLRYSEVMEER